MLRIHQSNSTENAKSYFTSGLEDAHAYYAAGQSSSGQWFGEGAKLLGLSGDVKKKQFFQLCENRRPDNGEKLNPRENAFRKIGYDITFSAPKSVSLAQEVLGDRRIIGVFQDAVRLTMRYIEREAHTRVRKGYEVDTRKTGNLIWAEFTHFESRPIDGKSDCQLHCHCYTLNSTSDSVEGGRFKALEFYNVKRDAVYYQALFHSKLAEGLGGLGYVIENKPFSFEIAGIGEGNLKKFSRRTKEIEDMALEMGIRAKSAAMAKLGGKSRQSKKQSLKGKAQLDEWNERFDWSEVRLNAVKAPQQLMSADEAVNRAIDRMFETKSLVQVKRLAAEAMQLSLGECSFESIVKSLKEKKSLVLSVQNSAHYVTTKEIVDEEKSAISSLKISKRRAFSMNNFYQCKNDLLDADQKAAVEAIMHSRDRFICIEGKAGTGKTSMMKTAVCEIERCGFKVFAFAPTSSAAHQVLKNEGFENSDTIQQLLVNPILQEKVKGQIMWVDEAGLISVKDMNKLMKIATNRNARVIFTGDASQHRSVNRGDAFRLICESGLVEVKSLRTVYRQRKEAYRGAIGLISDGNIEDALEVLDEMGAIREVEDPIERAKEIAFEFVKSIDQSGSVLAVAPTHLECDLITHEIRAEMKASGKLTGKGVEVSVYRNRNLFDNEKAMSLFYEPGNVVRFRRKVGAFETGEVVRIVSTDDSEILVQKASGEKLPLDLSKSKNFDICYHDRIEMAVGERVRLNRNVTGSNGEKLYNGNLHVVTEIVDDEITLDNKVAVNASLGVLDYGVVSTSYASQGKTCDKVILSQSNLSIGASSQEQFYVAASRGRSEIIIFTDSKEDLRDAVGYSERRMSATELLRDGEVLTGPDRFDDLFDFSEISTKGNMNGP